MKSPARFTSIFLFFAVFIFPSTRAQTKPETTSWYGNRTEAGVGFGFGKFKTDLINGTQLSVKNNEIVFMIQTINGIKIQDRAFLGLGVGYELWQHGSFVPVFGHLSYDILKKENSILATLNIGYSYGTREATTDYQSGKGGFMASVGLGYRQKISNALKFVYEVFYKYQVINSSYNIIITDSIGQIKNTSTSDYTLPNHFFGFRIGIVY